MDYLLSNSHYSWDLVEPRPKINFYSYFPTRAADIHTFLIPHFDSGVQNGYLYVDFSAYIIFPMSLLSSYNTCYPSAFSFLYLDPGGQDCLEENIQNMARAIGFHCASRPARVDLHSCVYQTSPFDAYFGKFFPISHIPILHHLVTWH